MFDWRERKECALAKQPEKGWRRQTDVAVERQTDVVVQRKRGMFGFGEAVERQTDVAVERQTDVAVAVAAAGSVMLWHAPGLSR